MAPGKAPRALIPISQSDVEKRNLLNYQFNLINPYLETKPSNFRRHMASRGPPDIWEGIYRTRIRDGYQHPPTILEIHRIVGKHH